MANEIQKLVHRFVFWSLLRKLGSSSSSDQENRAVNSSFRGQLVCLAPSGQKNMIRPTMSTGVERCHSMIAGSLFSFSAFHTVWVCFISQLDAGATIRCQRFFVVGIRLSCFSRPQLCTTPCASLFVRHWYIFGRIGR
jgi:hypothetical protein